MSVFSSPDFDQHENVVFGYDQDSGLRAVIAIHNSNLGPAMGGCRMYPYASERDALRDVLRLSKGMSYKAALAGVALGGGKSVVIGNPLKDKSRQLFEAMGRLVDTLSGKYIAAQDMGINVQDLEQMATQSEYVSGIRNRVDELGKLRTGDPSPATALGVFCGIKAALTSRLNRHELEGIRVAIQGLGNVGYHLARLLHEAGAKLWVSDINKARESEAIREFGAIAVNAGELISLDVDVFCPCAMGAILNDQTIATLQAKIIAGAANNQLLESKHGANLHNKGILYAPDYVINAGGLIDLFYLDHGKPAADVKNHVENIANTLADIFTASKRKNLATNIIADDMAAARFQFSYAQAS